jgi:membrane associated rhomboid family serine protease
MIVIDKSIPEGTAAMLRFFGEAVGGAIPSFVLGLIVLLIVRFLRRRSGAPFAGLSGAIVTLATPYSQYIGELHHLGRLH